MNKKKSSLSLFVLIGISVAIGYIAALWNVIAPVIPFWSEIVTYLALVILFGMSIHVSKVWNLSKKYVRPADDIDTQNAKQEKIAHQFIGATSLLFIATTLITMMALLAWDKQASLSTTISTFSLLSILCFSIFAQQNAIKFQKKYSPGAFVNMKRVDDYEEHFKDLDEGEKFEQYRIAYKSFYAMNLFFPVILLILFFISHSIQPQYIALLAVGTLWFIMYAIYYREGAKAH